jgi:uncharacterized protein (TIGR02246 family)
MTPETSPEMKPEDIHTQFRDRFRARDVEGLLALYEDDAVFMFATSHEVCQGKAALREALHGFLAIEGDFMLETRYAARNGDLALISNSWRLVGKDPTGQPLELTGRSAEVVRRQPDGRWLFMLDHAYGGQ